MCFSASASFGAGIVLSVIGIVTVKKVQTPAQRAFAVIPLIFAVQQISEGFLWLALSDSRYAFLREPMTYAFLFFAQVVWPVWVPFSVMKFEQKTKNKKVQRLITVIGALVSIYLAYCLLVYPVSAEILGRHISYNQDYPEKLSLYGGTLYIIATILPPFLSSIRGMWVLGIAILVSYIITTLFYEDYIVSVWCFFASVISLTVLAIILGIKKVTAKIQQKPAIKTW